MAGMGKRMRPHTLTIPKPLIPVAGKPIVQRLVEEIADVVNETIEEIAFIIGDFGQETENKLKLIAKNTGAKPVIYYQKEALGTGHAIYCAEPSLNGKIVVAFADTLFKAGFKLNDKYDGSIWVNKVENPEAFGVVKTNNENIITDFFEKPKTFVSDLAIIGIYYFKKGEQLKDELKYLIDNNIIVNGEYQLTDALENMKKKKLLFSAEKVEEWLDCGNKDATVYTNQRILEYHKSEELIATSAKTTNSAIIRPCYIGDNANIKNSIIGPHVSIGKNTTIKNSIIQNSIIQENTCIEESNICNSMIGNNTNIKGKATEMSAGDYTSITK